MKLRNLTFAPLSPNNAHEIVNSFNPTVFHEMWQPCITMITCLGILTVPTQPRSSLAPAQSFAFEIGPRLSPQVASCFYGLAPVFFKKYVSSMLITQIVSGRTESHSHESSAFDEQLRRSVQLDG